MTPSKTSIPQGYCQCGCGQATSMYPYNNAAKGWVKGKYFKRVAGHARRNFRPPVEQPEAHKIIRLTKDAVALVSNFDFMTLSLGRWHLSNKGYAITTKWLNGKRAYMHRVIMNAPKGLEVDHINGNPLDNRRENLRLCSHSQNGAHKAHPRRGFRGVYQVSSRRWQARIKHHGKMIHLGSFTNPVEAARRWNQEAIKLHGAFATLNEVPNEA